MVKIIKKYTFPIVSFRYKRWTPDVCMIFCIYICKLGSHLFHPNSHKWLISPLLSPVNLTNILLFEIVSLTLRLTHVVLCSYGLLETSNRQICLSIYLSVLTSDKKLLPIEQNETFLGIKFLLILFKNVSLRSAPSRKTASKLSFQQEYTK